MTCTHDNAIKIFRGDDTNWNDEVLLSFQVTSETADLSTMTAEFILGGIKKTNISLADSGEFEISLSHTETSTLPWGLNNGILKIYDAEKRIKTVANNIPFWVTDDPVGMQSGTIVIPVPEASAVSIVLQVGIKYVTEAELQAVQADLQAQIDGKQPAGNYATVAQLNTGLSGKQDTISDLSTIRNGATLGTTAVQPTDLNTALDTKQDKLTQTQLDAVNSGANADKIGQIATNTTNIGNEVTARQNADLGLQNQIDALSAASDVTDIVGTYADLQAYDTQHLKDNDIIKVITDSTHNNASSYYRWYTHTNNFTYIGSEGPYTTPEQLQAGLNTKLDITAAASTYATQSALTSGLAGKQDAIADLSTIRSGAEAGATALQQSDVDDSLSSSSQKPVENQVITNKLTALIPYIQGGGVAEMNRETVVDAADLLSATGDLHALDLDLSTNTQLKKLTAKGTSGNLANVSSVLVSNEAPFDNATSPQLDVSYTGLNKAALVNLFNSMPYNVGYTVVGSPTITDGVASGFSTSNYLKITPTKSNITSIEMGFKVTTPNTLVADEYILRQGTSYRITVSSTPYFNFTCSTSGGTATTVFSNTVVQPNTTYWLKVTLANNVLTSAISTDGVNYTESTSSYTGSLKDFSSSFGTTLGASADSSQLPFSGSIDLNYTYIKMDGAAWFMGQAAMTKTCSVVGCTGTADLTQADKNITLNKGWALTVA